MLILNEIHNFIINLKKKLVLKFLLENMKYFENITLILVKLRLQNSYYNYCQLQKSNVFLERNTQFNNLFIKTN